ncbi:cbb3-type cytochrome c oxidase subunit 3 [Aestuariicoccus sp. MJ-SS9]|uniref:cbb3-type cytochrome c oxidase subunit 3 n=1 Tax=Aestuariicoccus sp. MJ-SS9 TaxID=3079855 RepID=UPI00290DFB10|nr:cbb3-type cytochrome c oxidase subunit 3 [Aestuariicoccus sp. MJ-SS9]MDU8911835.1 cbb3-type cytochrome c oxidase subunit 3 [Aestuariicoccus sp. MJ-SS9]
METYTFLRQLADSWVLLALFLFFAGVVFWAFRPGSGSTHSDAASIPLRNEDRPLAEPKTPAEKEART